MGGVQYDPLCVFLPFTQKMFSQPKTSPNFLLRTSLWRGKNEKIIFTPSQSIFLDTQFGNDLELFALIKRILLQTLVEMILRYNNFFFNRLLGPPEQNKILYEVLGIKPG